MTTLAVLIIEDSDDDAILVQSQLEMAGFALTTQRVDRPDDLHRALEASRWDIVLSDYSMPQLTALDALAILKESRQEDVPFIIVSGSIGEESAVAALKAGASNYVMKHNLAQLLPVVQRELKDAQTRRERREAFLALEQAVVARDEFLSIASHELKTPLTSLRLQAQSLARLARQQDRVVLDNAVVVRRIDSIERSADRLTTLIERLLDITRVRAGHLSLSRETVDLVGLARHCVQTMADTFHDAGCEVSITAPDELVGQWDRERLETLVVSFLSNAAKFGARQPIRVEVSDDADQATLHVIDYGIGISPEDQLRIFTRFGRAVPERNYGGFGVGLWLAQQIAEAHGGRIEVLSNTGRGSTFSVTLPKAGADA